MILQGYGIHDKYEVTNEAKANPQWLCLVMFAHFDTVIREKFNNLETLEDVLIFYHSLLYRYLQRNDAMFEKFVRWNLFFPKNVNHLYRMISYIILATSRIRLSFLEGQKRVSTARHALWGIVPNDKGILPIADDTIYTYNHLRTSGVNSLFWENRNMEESPYCNTNLMIRNAAKKPGVFLIAPRCQTLTNSSMGHMSDKSSSMAESNPQAQENGWQEILPRMLGQVMTNLRRLVLPPEINIPFLKLLRREYFEWHRWNNAKLDPIKFQNWAQPKVEVMKKHGVDEYNGLSFADIAKYWGIHFLIEFLNTIEMYSQSTVLTEIQEHRNYCLDQLAQIGKDGKLKERLCGKKNELNPGYGTIFVCQMLARSLAGMKTYPQAFYKDNHKPFGKKKFARVAHSLSCITLNAGSAAEDFASKENSGIKLVENFVTNERLHSNLLVTLKKIGPPNYLYGISNVSPSDHIHVSSLWIKFLEHRCSIFLLDPNF